MARINIDDELHAEKGFKRLVRKLGDEDKAVGLLYRFWRIAQDYWGDDCGLVPIEEFEADGLTPILEAGLAEIRDTGVYAKGAEERFAWYLQKCRASKAAARARSGNRDTPADTPSPPAAGPPEPGSRSTGTPPPNHPTVPVPVPATSSATVTALAPTTGITHPITREDIQECGEAWRDTLRKFGAGRTLLPDEETQIGRAIQRYGPKAVTLALEGARHEPRDERFDPAKFLSLRRILADEHFTRFLNLGVQARHKDQARAGPAPPGLSAMAIPVIPRESA